MYAGAYYYNNVNIINNISLYNCCLCCDIACIVIIFSSCIRMVSSTTQLKANGAQSGSNQHNGGSNQHNGVSPVQQEPDSKAEAIQDGFLMRIAFPFTLILLMPNLVLWLWYTVKYYDGSFLKFTQVFLDSPVWLVTDVWSKVNIGTPFTLSVIGGYMTFQAILMKMVPGRIVQGPVTTNGNTPTYVDNGFRIFLITMASFVGLSWFLKTYTIYSPSLIYDNFGDLLATMNIFSLVFCVGLYFKGLYMPSTTDSGSGGNPLFDYYWGIELYPRVFGIDVKVGNANPSHSCFFVWGA